MYNNIEPESISNRGDLILRYKRERETVSATIPWQIRYITHKKVIILPENRPHYSISLLKTTRSNLKRMQSIVDSMEAIASDITVIQMISLVSESFGTIIQEEISVVGERKHESSPTHLEFIMLSRVDRFTVASKVILEIKWLTR